MNRKNLQKMAGYIRKIPQRKFDMGLWRGNLEDMYNHECNSVGCVIGHCIVLDKFENVPFTLDYQIDFVGWSDRFTGLRSFSKEWVWCFSGLWVDVDNTPEGAAKRIEWLLNNGLPENCTKQLHGYAPLCY